MSNPIGGLVFCICAVLFAAAPVRAQPSLRARLSSSMTWRSRISRSPSAYNCWQPSALVVICRHWLREQLIDDRLRVSVARRLEIELSDEELQVGLENFAQARNLTTEQVSQALGGRGIADQSLIDFIEAQLIWRNVVQALFRARATPTEADLDAALDYAERAVQESVLLQEIAMPFAERGEDATLEIARRLSRELNRGGNFAAAASALLARVIGPERGAAGLGSRACASAASFGPGACASPGRSDRTGGYRGWRRHPQAARRPAGAPRSRTR